MYDVTDAVLQWMIDKSGKKELFKSLKAIKKIDTDTIFPIDTARELLKQFDYDKRIREDTTTLLGIFRKKQSILQFEEKSFVISGDRSYVPVTYIPTKQDTDIIEIYVDHMACCFWQKVISFQSDNKEQPLLNSEIVPYFLLYVQSIYSHERFHRLMAQVLYLHDTKNMISEEISEGLTTAFSYHQLMFLAMKPTGRMRVFSRTRMEQLILYIMPSDEDCKDKLWKYRLWRNYIEPMRFMRELDKSLKINSYDILFDKWKHTSLKDFIFIIEPWINWNARERIKFIESQTGNEIINK